MYEDMRIIQWFMCNKLCFSTVSKIFCNIKTKGGAGSPKEQNEDVDTYLTKPSQAATLDI